MVLIAVFLAASLTRTAAAELAGPSAPQGSLALVGPPHHPQEAHRQEAPPRSRVAPAAMIYLSGQALDYGLTEYGLAHGFHESNPLMRRRSVRTVYSLGLAAGFTWYDLREKDRGRRRVVRVVYFSVQAFAAGWNLRQLAKQRER